jgi:hypothetical protein
MTLTWWVNLVTNPVRKPQITPITVPPIATTKNDAIPATHKKKTDKTALHNIFIQLLLTCGMRNEKETNACKKIKTITRKILCYVFL